MNELTNEQIKKILAGAPDGAVFISHGDYISANGCGMGLMPDGIRAPILYLLSDLREILTLRERVGELEQDGWISVKDGLPREFIDVVLVSRVGTSVMPAFYNGEDFVSLSICGSIPYKEPTHWQHLPQPPKEGSDE